jgi:carbamoyltransferase
MSILGISAFYHDSAAALIANGEIIAAAQEERFTRRKHESSFPVNAIQYCLEEGGLSIAELDAVVFYDKPFLKFERLLETYYNFAPAGLRSFTKAVPVWVKEKLFLKRIIRKELSVFSKNIPVLLFPEHHLSHAASAFFPSPFEESAILTVDGVGEWATASICHGKGKSIRVLRELHFPHSLGLLYSSFTYFLGFEVNSGEYKLMGLAPYGNPDDAETATFIRIIEQHLVAIKEDGSIFLNPKHFTYATGLKMVNDKDWKILFGFSRRQSDGEIAQHHCNLALAIQLVMEKVLLKMALEAKRLTGSQHLCLAGGVALNCVANGKIQQERIFKDIYIQAAAGDAGGALGAAFAAHHIYFDQERSMLPGGSDKMKGSYLGPEFSDLDILKTARKYKANWTKKETVEELVGEVAQYLASGKVVGWFQGKMEFGPRALGNRSILADARNPEMQTKLNLKIKNRESFRPFAPSVLEESCPLFFEYTGTSPYMLLVHKVIQKRRKTLPENFSYLSLEEKLNLERSDIPAVTHVDFSARIQTVRKSANPRYYALLKAFEKLTGTGLLINTSFNVRGEPIVCTPKQAFQCFMHTQMDYLVMNNFIFTKKIAD